MTEEIIQQISEKVNDTYTMMGALLALGLAILIIFSIRSVFLCIEQDKKQAQQEREQLKKDIQEAIEAHERKRRIREEFDGCSEDFMEELETLLSKQKDINYTKCTDEEKKAVQDEFINLCVENKLY